MTEYEYKLLNQLKKKEQLFTHSTELLTDRSKLDTNIIVITPKMLNEMENYFIIDAMGYEGKKWVLAEKHQLQYNYTSENCIVNYSNIIGHQFVIFDEKEAMKIINECYIFGYISIQRVVNKKVVSLYQQVGKIKKSKKYL